MKKHLKLVFVLFLGIGFLNVNAQEEMQYLFKSGDNDVSVSGFAEVFNEFSGFDSDFAFSMGGGAALLVNQKVYLGAYGMGLTTRHQRDYTWYDRYLERNIDMYDLYTRFGHGGLWTGYIFQPKKAFNFAADVKIGWGSYSVTDKSVPGDEYKWENYVVDNVFVLTPQVKLNMNLLKWMRASVGIGYRYVAGVNEEYTVKENGELVEKPYYDKNAFNSLTGNLTLAFGWFGN